MKKRCLKDFVCDGETNMTFQMLIIIKRESKEPPGLVPEWYPGLSALSSSGVRSPYKPITQRKKRESKETDKKILKHKGKLGKRQI